MTRTIEDRVRAHYADRAARDTLPGPETDTVLHEAQQGPPGGPGAVGRVVGRIDPRRPRTWLAVAAAVVALAGTAGVVAARDDGGTRVSTSTPSTTTAPDREPDPPSPDTTSPSTAPSTTAATATTDPPPPPGAAPTGPFVAIEGILGSWSGSAWVRWEAGATPTYGDEYQIVGLADGITTAVGEEGVDCAPNGNPIVTVGLSSSDKLAPVPIGMRGVADPQPRAVEVLDPTAATYRDAVVEFLAARGVDDPNPQVSQVVRSDIDGDGTSEVVVVAERFSDPVSWTAAEGDYAVAFVRRVIGGEVRTSEIVMWLAGASEGTISNVVYRAQALADLNGDGRMEVVLGARSWEGSRTSVHEMRPDGTLGEVLDVECGV